MIPSLRPQSMDAYLNHTNNPRAITGHLGVLPHIHYNSFEFLNMSLSEKIRGIGFRFLAVLSKLMIILIQIIQRQFVELPLPWVTYLTAPTSVSFFSFLGAARDISE